MQCGVTRGGVAALPEALCREAALWRGGGGQLQSQKRGSFPSQTGTWGSWPQNGIAALRGAPKGPVFTPAEALLTAWLF